MIVKELMTGDVSSVAMFWFSKELVHNHIWQSLQKSVQEGLTLVLRLVDVS